MIGSILDYAIYLAAVPALLLIVAVLVVAVRTKARMRREEGKAGKEPEPDALRVIADATEADEIALSIVERYRKRIWRRFSISTSFGIASIGDLCSSLISEIAHVYYPNSPRPELEVTLDDLLELNERVIARVRRLLEKFPLRRLRGVRMSQVITYHKLYAAVSGNVLVRSVRKKWARRAVRSAAIAARYASPRFWIMRGLTRGGREFAARYLLTSVVTIAGEEAILLYRRRAAEVEESPEEAGAGSAGDRG
jgi:hypothetical protein